MGVMLQHIPPFSPHLIQNWQRRQSGRGAPTPISSSNIYFHYHRRFLLFVLRFLYTVDYCTAATVSCQRIKVAPIQQILGSHLGFCLLTPNQNLHFVLRHFWPLRRFWHFWCLPLSPIYFVTGSFLSVLTYFFSHSSWFAPFMKFQLRLDYVVRDFMHCEHSQF